MFKTDQIINTTFIYIRHTTIITVHGSLWYEGVQERMSG